MTANTAAIIVRREGMAVLSLLPRTVQYCCQKRYAALPAALSCCFTRPLGYQRSRSRPLLSIVWELASVLQAASPRVPNRTKRAAEEAEAASTWPGCEPGYCARQG